MTVNPGFGGQSFIEACAQKVKILRDLRQSLNLNFNIEVDGGINNETIKICVDNGQICLLLVLISLNRKIMVR